MVGGLIVLMNVNCRKLNGNIKKSAVCLAISNKNCIFATTLLIHYGNSKDRQH